MLLFVPGENLVKKEGALYQVDCQTKTKKTKCGFMSSIIIKVQTMVRLIQH
jgi:hypothetical protein